MMKVRILCIFFILFAFLTSFAQKRQYYQAKSSTNSGYKRTTIDYDSIWAFSPLIFNMQVGMWTPVGTLGEYFVSSPKFAFGAGRMVSHRMKWEMNMSFHFMNSRKQVLFNSDTFRVDAKNINSFGMGGLFYYTLGKNRLFHVDLLTGAGVEIVNTSSKSPKRDSDGVQESMQVTTCRIDLGADILVNAIRDRNLGVRVLCSYVPYNMDGNMITSVGSYAISTSLIYFFSKRKQAYRGLFL